MQESWTIPNPWAFLRTLLLSRSLHTAQALHTPERRLAEVRIPGYPGSFKLRTGTSDADFVRTLANRYEFSSYQLPAKCDPRVILDIGANIGAVTACLAVRYPNAHIYAFEPLPETYELLAHNVSRFDNVIAVPFGLGCEDGRRPYYHSDDPLNFGGGGFHRHPAMPHGPVEMLNVLSVENALSRYGLDRVDMIKIDTEGSEYEILGALPPHVLRRVQVIVGELHGDPIESVLAILRPAFDLQLVQPRADICCFQAIRRSEQRVTLDVVPILSDPIIGDKPTGSPARAATGR